jgi:hypothetical protein
MSTSMKIILIIVIVLNAMVLMGELWPEGKPPFARVVSIATLCIDLVFFLGQFWKDKRFGK